jgi:hypothetical protein
MSFSDTEIETSNAVSKIKDRAGSTFDDLTNYQESRIAKNISKRSSMEDPQKSRKQVSGAIERPKNRFW